MTYIVRIARDRRKCEMTMYKEIGLNVSWDTIVTDVMKHLVMPTVDQNEIDEIAEKMRDVEHRYIDIE